MTAFKVGDRVRIISSRWTSEFEGMIGTVEDIWERYEEDGGRYRGYGYEVSLDDGSYALVTFPGDIVEAADGPQADSAPAASDQ